MAKINRESIWVDAATDWMLVDNISISLSKLFGTLNCVQEALITFLVLLNLY